MSKTYGKWTYLVASCLAVACMVCMMSVRSSVAEVPVRNQLRMSVDFTVLPMVLPDGTETPAQQAVESDLGEPETITPPEEVQVEATPKPEPQKPQPETPKQAPAPKAKQDIQKPGTIESVTVKETDTGFTITIQTDRPVADTSYINLTDPRRLVFDLIGPWKYHNANVIRLDGTIKHVVVGEHADRIRLVVHFRTPPTGPVKPTVKTTDTTLTATVTLQ